MTEVLRADTVMRNPRREHEITPLKNCAPPLDALAYADIMGCRKIAMVRLKCMECLLGCIFSLSLTSDISLAEAPDYIVESYFAVCTDKDSIRNVDALSILYAVLDTSRAILVSDTVDALKPVLRGCRLFETYLCIEDYVDLEKLVEVLREAYHSEAGKG